MLRRLQTTDGKNIDVMCKAEVALVRGMLVQKDLANKLVKLPTSQVGLYFVDRDNQPTGLMGYEGDISEYDERLEKIKAGENVQLEPLFVGERYATDQFVADGLTIGGHVKADATGKVVNSVEETRLVYGGTYNDNGRTLAIIEVQ